MAVIACKACGRLNLLEELRERNTCELCGQAMQLPSSAPVAPARTNECFAHNNQDKIQAAPLETNAVQESLLVHKDPHEQPVDRKLVRWVARQLLANTPIFEIERELRDQGVEAVTAHRLVENLRQLLEKRQLETFRSLASAVLLLLLASLLFLVGDFRPCAFLFAIPVILIGIVDAIHRQVRGIGEELEESWHGYVWAAAKVLALILGLYFGAYLVSGLFGAIR